MQGKDNVILVADIGGTNCRFELWQTPAGGGQKLLEKVDCLSALAFTCAR